ncbi:MAG TPA: PQQ-binding-like beta-propeller repeat protein [bacterium]|nr:PQQ-binding-like beta-propeller repeat protein [bacterium]
MTRSGGLLIGLAFWILSCGSVAELSRETYIPPSSPPFHGEKIGEFRIESMSTGEPVVLDPVHTAWLSGKGEILIFNHRENDMAQVIKGKDPITGFAYRDGNFVWTEVNRDKNVVRFSNDLTEEVWRITSGSYAAPPLIADSLCLLAQVNGRINAVGYDSGKVHWTEKLSGRIFTSPLVDDSTYFVSTDAGHLYALHVETGAILWEVRIEAPVWVMSLDDRALYLGTYQGEFVAVDRSEHTIRWRVQSESQVRNRPLITTEYLYWTNTGGEVYRIRKATGEYTRLTRLIVPIAGAPARTDRGLLLSGLDKVLYHLDSETGEVLQKIELEGRLRSTPLYMRNRWIVAMEDHWIYALE